MDFALEEMVSPGLQQRIREQVEVDMPKAVMPTGAVLLVEMLHDDGLKYLHFIRPDDTTAWQAVGMAQVAAHHYTAQCEED